ncbi:hypothetical protein H8356DRAFT_1072423 [Neocallimastix lanati (nom. inval.)]|nr:hypothetical protein H8356DRAFT_1072423 [Neocallimastix sp. JGI-2020a]
MKKIHNAQEIIAVEKIQKAWKNYRETRYELFPYNEKALTLPAIEIGHINDVFKNVLDSNDEIEVDNWLHNEINYDYDDKMNNYLNQSEMTIELNINQNIPINLKIKHTKTFKGSKRKESRKNKEKKEINIKIDESNITIYEENKVDIPERNKK